MNLAFPQHAELSCCRNPEATAPTSDILGGEMVAEKLLKLKTPRVGQADEKQYMVGSGSEFPNIGKIQVLCV